MKSHAHAATGNAVWTLKAHRKATSSLAFNPAAKGVLATGGVDKLVKLWAVRMSASAHICELSVFLFPALTGFLSEARPRYQIREKREGSPENVISIGLYDDRYLVRELRLTSKLVTAGSSVSMLPMPSPDSGLYLCITLT